MHIIKRDSLGGKGEIENPPVCYLSELMDAVVLNFSRLGVSSAINV